MMDAASGETRGPPSSSSLLGGHTQIQGKKESSSSLSPGVKKPPFRLVQDDTKPILRDPILRSYPIETEEAVLRLPPFPLKEKAEDSSILSHRDRGGGAPVATFSFERKG